MADAPASAEEAAQEAGPTPVSKGLGTSAAQYSELLKELGYEDPSLWKDVDDEEWEQLEENLKKSFFNFWTHEFATKMFILICFHAE